MNSQQACVHIARNSADRLAEQVSSELPRDVTRAFADADRTLGDASLGDDDTGYDVPTLRDAASLVVACAIHGTDALRQNALGVGPVEELSPPELLGAVQAKLRHATQLPPGMEEDRYDRIVTVVSEEVVNALGRRDVPHGG